MILQQQEAADPILVVLKRGTGGLSLLPAIRRALPWTFVIVISELVTARISMRDEIVGSGANMVKACLYLSRARLQWRLW